MWDGCIFHILVPSAETDASSEGTVSWRYHGWSVFLCESSDRRPRSACYGSTRKCGQNAHVREQLGTGSWSNVGTGRKKKQPDFCFHEDWVVLGSIILATPRARKGLLFWHPWLSFISSWTMKVIAIVNACWESHSWEAKSRACIDCFNEFPLQFSKITRTPHPTPMVSMENQRLKRSAFLPRFRESGSCTAEILTHLTKIRSSSPDHNFKLRSRTETRSGQQGRPV